MEKKKTQILPNIAAQPDSSYSNNLFLLPTPCGTQSLICHCCLQDKARGCFFMQFLEQFCWDKAQSGSGGRSCTSLDFHTSFAQLHEALLKVFRLYPQNRITERDDVNLWLCIFCRASFPAQELCGGSVSNPALAACRGSSKWRCSVQTLSSPCGVNQNQFLQFSAII